MTPRLTIHHHTPPLAILLLVLAGKAYAGTSSKLQVTVRVDHPPVAITVSDDARGVEVTAEEIRAFCEENGLMPSERMMRPGEVPGWGSMEEGQ